MKTEQVNKLYAKLTPNEQAALVIGALVRQDEGEIAAILDSVERCNYRGLNPDYRQRVEGLYMLAGLYGINYWKTRALMLMAFNIDSDDRTCSIARQFIARLASMDAALLDVCRRIKVDVEAVKTLADCKGETGFSDYVEAELVEQYTELFTKAVMLE